MNAFIPVIVLLSLAVGAITLILGIKKLTQAGKNRTTFLLAIGIALCAMMATFASVFSIIDALVVDIQLSDLAGSLKNLNKAKLMLKVSIILVSFKLFTSLFKLNKSSGILKTMREDFGGQAVLSKKAFKNLSIAEWDEKLASTNESEGRFIFMELRNFSQLAFYLSVTLILLVQYLSQDTAGINGEVQKASLFFAIANGALFFILDDWNIMNDYSRKMKGNILANHRTKIRVTNLVLLIACPILLFVLFTGVDSTASSNDLPFILVFIAILAFAYYWRTYLDFNKYVEEPKKKK